MVVQRALDVAESLTTMTFRAVFLSFVLFTSLCRIGPVQAEDGHEHAESVDVAEFSSYVEGAARLEGRLLAPCCWNQTLDIHGSPAATELRREIRKRLRGGETPDVIEASIIARHGDKILAVPKGSPLAKLGMWLALALGLAAFGVIKTLVRWNRQGADEKPRAEGSTASTPEVDDWDERLDDELSRLDRDD